MFKPVLSKNAFASEWATLERHTQTIRLWRLLRAPTKPQRRFIPLRFDEANNKDSLKQSSGPGLDFQLF